MVCSIFKHLGHLLEGTGWKASEVGVAIIASIEEQLGKDVPGYIPPPPPEPEEPEDRAPSE